MRFDSDLKSGIEFDLGIETGLNSMLDLFFCEFGYFFVLIRINFDLIFLKFSILESRMISLIELSYTADAWAVK